MKRFIVDIWIENKSDFRQRKNRTGLDMSTAMIAFRTSERHISALLAYRYAVAVNSFE